MPMTPGALSAELQNIPLTVDEAEAITNFANAFTNYFYDASVAGVACAAGSLDAAKSAMEGAMTGLSTTGALSIQAGVTAFWGVVVPSAATIWTTVPPVILATPPPGLAGLAAALSAVFVANVSAELDKAAACDAIAATWHPINLGGLATQQAPPAPPVVVPIL